ncbi:MAG: NAD(P)/FAD-dependent oxidoreductase [Anaerolineae bacterium]|jgi:protoporphyrinogen oxidase|nr:NAD(P)/FAD-dependent oxidoreductase [Anaerolineae bacterium]MDH7473165.1 NAD(P)/FAD-dependent oxidoreductase [Anaerolineae bacterium]
MEKIAIVGGGITGMAAADFLSQAGHRVTILERDATLGGLAGSFEVNGVYLERFYHHLFTSDTAMEQLIHELGLGDDFAWQPTVTSYYAHRIYRLATPIDVLRFTPLPFFDRIRLGMLAIIPRFISNWKPLENITAKEWLIRLAGERVYRQVWEPLLRQKFGRYADQVAAVWFWNKLKLRGGSRGKGQAEYLGYLRGGFGRLLDAWEQRLRAQGVVIRTQSPVEEVRIENGAASGVIVNGVHEPFDVVLVTVAPELFARLAPGLPADYRARLEKIVYLANACLVLKLKHGLSNTYWLNINDPEIPFVALIEHTNMQRPEEYGGAHLVYLSRYMAPDDPYYQMSAEELFRAYLPGLKKLFPQFNEEWVERVWVWRERYTQPVIGLHYSQLKPPFKTPVENLWLSCMAQVYPEDRGMNYALVYGRKAAEEMMATWTAT